MFRSVRRAAWLPLAALGLLSPACSDDASPVSVDAALDRGLDLSLRESSADRHSPDAGPFGPAGGAGHADVGEALSAGQARAGRVTAASQLLPGIKVQGRVGDYKIYNDRVAFIIEDARPSDGLAPYGGELLDGVRLGQPGAAGQSLLGETILGLGVLLLKPSSVGVVSDGSGGGPAMIRVIGDPAPFPLLAAVLGENTGDMGKLRLAVDFVLAPGSSALEIRWRVWNGTAAAIEVPAIIVGLTAGDGSDYFAEGKGFDVGTAPESDYVAMIGRDVAYTLFSQDAPLTPLIQELGMWALGNGTITVGAGSEVGRHYRMILTAGEPEAARRAAREARKDPEPAALTGKVKGPGDAAVVGARVHVQQDSADKTYVTMARTDAQGRYHLALAPGKYLVNAIADGHGPGAQASVTVGTTALTLDLPLPGSATLTYHVVDAKSASALPARVRFRPEAAPPSWPATFGEDLQTTMQLTHFSASGSGSASLPPGSYTVIATRGPEYELDQQTVTLAAGESKELALKLTRSVDSSGYMCGDFHVHAMWSPDANNLYETKASAMVAEGLEIPVLTEHEYIGDLSATVAKLGLQPWLRVIIGEEVTTLVYGHFNPFPLTQDPSRSNNGAVVWYHKDPTTLFEEIHTTWPNAILQVNHPRGIPQSSYFSYLDYDPGAGTTKRPSEWSRAFEAIEVFNGAGWAYYQDSTVKDWFSFLDRGVLVTATGNSDNHEAYWGGLGYPRNCVQLSTDDPAKLDLSELTKAIKEQRVMVSGGPFVTVSVGGKSLGDVVDASAKKVSVQVRVQAPSWMPVDQLQLIVGGEIVHQASINASTTDPQNPALRFNQTIDVPVDADSWLIAVVTGSKSLDPLYGGEPFAITNPIYLDVDKDGVYDPPKSF